MFSISKLGRKVVRELSSAQRPQSGYFDVDTWERRRKCPSLGIGRGRLRGLEVWTRSVVVEGRDEGPTKEEVDRPPSKFKSGVVTGLWTRVLRKLFGLSSPR